VRRQPLSAHDRDRSVVVVFAVPVGDREPQRQLGRGGRRVMQDTVFGVVGDDP
jgi:hypothetical protein